MRTHLLVLAGSMVLVASMARPGTAGGIRTDHVSRKKLPVWKSIVAIVMAEDRTGQPLYPTLRRLWDAVDASGHTVYVELPDRRSYIGGAFVITRIDPDGRAHEGMLAMNLRVIDETSTGPAAARANGFIPLAGLGKRERYAEVLGHELAHAAWSFANPERARVAEALPREREQLSRRVLAARGLGFDDALQKDATRIERVSRELEEPAEAAEVAIWAELRGGQRSSLLTRE